MDHTFSNIILRIEMSIVSLKAHVHPNGFARFCFCFWNDSFVKCSVLIGFHFSGALRDHTKNDCEGD